MTTSEIRTAIMFMKSLQDAKVYMQLLHYATSETKERERISVVTLSPERRRKICVLTGVKSNNLSKHLASLKLLGLIEGERNDYVLKKLDNI